MHCTFVKDSIDCFLNGKRRPLLFIFVLSKHKFYVKTVDLSEIQTWIVRKEGEQADHLTTTMVIALLVFIVTTMRTYFQLMTFTNTPTLVAIVGLLMLANPRLSEQH